MANQAFNQVIRSVYDQLLQYTNPADPNSLLSAIEILLPEQDPDQIRDAVSRIDAGLHYGKSLADSGLLTSCSTVESVLEKLTAYMTPQEKKGLYLFLYESFRESDSLDSADAARAPHDHELFPGLSPEDLKAIVFRQLEFHAQDILTSMSESQEPEGAFPDDKPDPRILCAAYYVAGSTGDIPQCFCQIPEFSGICAELGQSTWYMAPDRKTELFFILIAALMAIAVIIAVTSNIMPGVCTYLLALIEKATFHQTMKTILASLVQNSLTHIAGTLAGTFAFVATKKELDRAYADLVSGIESDIKQEAQNAVNKQTLKPEIFA